MASQSTTTTTMPKAKNTKPLPLTHTLRDLAFLRASDLDLGTIVPVDKGDEHDDLVEESSEFVREARMALGSHARGEADVQGERVESIRSNMDELVENL
ncbi:hypothetical protein M378DRAFT_158065 [Amanita muscaria Koide BX008]|uniref:Uncharacterized protein n=1 Tax=Amanita muscaria (strain Koide BX008) TaxID=946122 RepID=A0A0C2TP01_AMAMK|nr:hypothetical protein M378DRAFT_158065 [Amanita muscaria Koide BX008]